MAFGHRPAATAIPLPAPWGGINTRDGLAALQPQEARHLENWTPSGNAVNLRYGRTSYSTGGVANQPVETLATFNGVSSSKLIGVGGGSVYDFSSSTASELSAAGYTDSRFQTECYNGILIGVNGTDTPWAYNGSAVGATGLSGSGLTIADLINIRKVRNRLWFCEKNEAGVWYGAVGAITGALTEFALGQIASGGYCMAIGAHSQDAGAGPDDYTAFIMSTGEVLLYSGDPASTFALVGSYMMPPPVGRQCLVNIGGQLAVITHMGLVPLTAAVAGVAFDILALGNFGKVAPSLKEDADDYGSLEGWSATFFDGHVIINVPTLTSAASKQWVYGTLNGTWTLWTGINFASIAVYNGMAYVGSWATGTVYKLSGTSDDGTAITTEARMAFFSTPGGRQIRATGIRFDMAVDGSFSGRFGFDTDYIERPITIPNVSLATSFATTPWGSPWGSAWSSSNQYKGKWFSTMAQGRALGLALQASGTVNGLSWFGVQVLVKPSASP